MKQFFKSLGICLGLVLAINFVMLFVGSMWSICMEETDDMSNYIYIISFISQFITLYIMDLLNEKQKVLDKNVFNKINLKDIMYISLFGIGCGIILFIILSALTQVMNLENQLEPVNFNILQIISLTILIPICEEIIFRHVMFGYLKNNHNIVFAVVVQAIFFGLGHMNIIQSSYTFILGIFLALIYIRYNSLLANITLHIVFNLMGVLIVTNIGDATSSLYFIIMLVGILCFILPLFKIMPKYKKNFFSSQANS